MSSLDIHQSQWDAIPHESSAIDVSEALQELPSARSSWPFAREIPPYRSTDDTNSEPRRADA